MRFSMLVTFVAMGIAPWRVDAADPPSAVGPLLGILQQGTLPPERLPAVAKMVCERGNEHDLAYIFEQVGGDDWPVELRREALEWLRTAAATRKVRPGGNLAALPRLIGSHDEALRIAAVKLAGEWKSPAAVEPLRTLAADDAADPAVRRAAVDALVAYGGDVALAAVDSLVAPTQPTATRMRGVAALARLDLDRAARLAAEIFKTIQPTDDPAPLVDAFLNVKGGADKLAAVLRQSPPSADAALLALRHMYAVGRSDASLDAVLSELAGVKAEAPKLSETEIKQMAERASAEGDAARGEAVFRRADLACMRCHSVSKAGGQVGPDLSAVGVSSPVDYLVKSVYDPDAQKKEEFATRILLTTDGQQLTGIIAKRTDDQITLKTADGKLVEIPSADIDFEGVGKSLMPEGLVKFMTDREVLDLVKFLSMLGRPGTAYEVRQGQRMQRWRLLKDAPPPVIDRVPDEELLGDLVLRGRTWEPVYSRVNGELPLQELVRRTGHPVVYVQGAVDVSAPGEARVQLNAPKGATLWLDDALVDLSNATVALPKGRHTLTLRLDTRERPAESLSLTLNRVEGSSAQFTVVDGQ